MLGTVGYMSPEQVRGKPADARSDIFAFGAILFEMISGRRAFHGESGVETMSAILKEDPPELSVNRNIRLVSTVSSSDAWKKILMSASNQPGISLSGLKLSPATRASARPAQTLLPFNAHAIGLFLSHSVWQPWRYSRLASSRAREQEPPDRRPRFLCFSASPSATDPSIPQDSLPMARR